MTLFGYQEVVLREFFRVSGDDENVPYPDYGGSDMALCICQNL